VSALNRSRAEGHPTNFKGTLKMVKQINNGNYSPLGAQRKMFFSKFIIIIISTYSEQLGLMG
jgi:hypothetical protein